jgi:uncharacterized membrane protein SirB2
LLALVAYIAVGHVAVRHARSVRGTLAAWLIGLALVLYIFAVAVSKSPTAGVA